MLGVVVGGIVNLHVRLFRSVKCYVAYSFGHSIHGSDPAIIVVLSAIRFLCARDQNSIHHVTKQPYNVTCT